jgi:hypothetical protein
MTDVPWLVQNLLFSFCNLKRTYQNMQNYKFTSCIVRMQNFVSHVKGIIQMEGVWEKGAEENIWAQEGWSNRRWRKLNNEELHGLYASPDITEIKQKKTGLTRM